MTRGEELWALVAGRITAGPVGVVREPGSAAPLPCSALAQAIHTAALWHPGTVPRLFRGARAYRRGDGYRPVPGRGRRCYDDNAAMALASLQHYRVTGDLRSLSRAQWVERFLLTGAVEGGLPRVEGGETTDAGATGLVGLVGAVLGRDPAQQVRVLAEMRRGDGVVGCQRLADGSLDPAASTANQGLLIALAHRAGAKRLAAEAIDAGAAHFTAERLSEQAVASNALYVRALASVGASLRSAESYAEVLWEDGRDERGWFGDRTSSRLRQTAAAAQIYAVLDGFDAALLL